MSLFLAKKQEDNNQKKVRDLLRLKENKKCFDCPTKSPAFVNTTIQTFICARCSGLVREVGHRVKAVSASKFSGAELMALKKGGNGIALKIWLSNYSTHDAPEPEADADVRAFMKQKYYECKWLDRALLQSHKQEVRALIAKSFTEDGLPIVTKSRTRMIPGFSRVPLIADNEMNVMQDDEEEDLETSVIQGDSVIPPPIAVPVYAVPPPPSQVQPQYQHYPATAAAATAAYPIPPTSPVCRTSMDSINSYSSSSQGGSIYNYRSSQEMIRNDMYATNSPMQTMGNAQQQVASTETNILTAEQIAERCRSSIDSNTSSSPSPSSASSNRQSMEAPQQQPVIAVAPMVLTAEQIAERCRNTVDYKTSAELYQQQDAYTPPTVVSEVAAPAAPVVSVAPVVPVAPVEKSLPQLNIDVNNNDLVYHRHRSDYQTPTLVNYNNNQSPSIQRDVHQVPASASLCVTPSTSNPITKPTRPPMAAPAASASIFDSILSDLAGLKLEKTVRRATYTGGMLSPATPAAVNNSPLEPSKSSPHPTDRPASMFSTDFFSQLNKSKATENKSPENDPYAALRGIPAPVVAAPVAAKIDATKDEERNTSSSSEDDDDEEDPWQEFCSSSSANENEDNFLEPQQVIQPALEESKPVSNMIAIDLFSDLDPRSMFKRL